MAPRCVAAAALLLLRSAVRGELEGLQHFVEDDECAAGSSCAVNALQHRAELTAARYGTCKDYGCANKYTRGQLCQCNALCKKHDNCCDDFKETCKKSVKHADEDEEGPVMTLYHQTSPKIGELILAGGFKPGSGGWCGGAIYFATSPQATITKASGLHSHHGFMIEAVVKLGRVKKMPSWCDMKMTGEKLHEQGYDTIVFNPVDGDEHVVYNSSRVLQTRHFPMFRR